MKKVLSLFTAMLCLALCLSACSSSSSSNSTPTPTPTKKDTFAVGETATQNGVKITLVGVTESAGSKYNKPKDGNVFVLCEFTIENNTDDDLTISSLLCFDAYADDYSTSFSLSALLEKGNKNQLDGTVAKGKKMNGVIGYEVPKTYKTLEISVKPDYIGAFKDKVTFVYNKK